MEWKAELGFQERAAVRCHYGLLWTVCRRDWYRYSLLQDQEAQTILGKNIVNERRKGLMSEAIQVTVIRIKPGNLNGMGKSFSVEREKRVNCTRLVVSHFKTQIC